MSKTNVVDVTVKDGDNEVNMNKFLEIKEQSRMGVESFDKVS